MVSPEPDRNLPYYQLNVSDNAPSYENYYQFAVDLTPFEIFYYDAEANRQYSLKDLVEPTW